MINFGSIVIDVVKNSRLKCAEGACSIEMAIPIPGLPVQLILSYDIENELTLTLEPLGSEHKIMFVVHSRSTWASVVHNARIIPA